MLGAFRSCSGTERFHLVEQVVWALTKWDVAGAQRRMFGGSFVEKRRGRKCSVRHFISM